MHIPKSWTNQIAKKEETNPVCSVLFNCIEIRRVTVTFSVVHIVFAIKKVEIELKTTSKLYVMEYVAL